MHPDKSLRRFDAAFEALPLAMRQTRPDCALILGSGWSEALFDDAEGMHIEYGAIPGLGDVGVEGHKGCLQLFTRHAHTILAFHGRRHWYECRDWGPVVLPVEICRRLGVRRLLVTNAAGGLSSSLSPGNLMLVRDHINTFGLNPLQGEHVPAWGRRFPDMTAVYDRVLCEMLRHAAQSIGLSLFEGVYAFNGGPSYETPAEVRALVLQGVDAVGMSTVPECMLAHAVGMRVAAVSCITNMAAGLSGPHTRHEDVLAQARRAAPSMQRLVDAFLERLQE